MYQSPITPLGQSPRFLRVTDTITVNRTLRENFIIIVYLQQIDI